MLHINDIPLLETDNTLSINMIRRKTVVAIRRGVALTFIPGVINYPGDVSAHAR